MSEDSYREAVQTADFLKALLASQGWKVLDSFLQKTREAYLEKLCVVKDMQDVLFYQAGIQVIDSIYAEIQGLIHNGEIARQALNHKTEV
jgi:hypothetical protein